MNWPPDMHRDDPYEYGPINHGPPFGNDYGSARIEGEFDTVVNARTYRTLTRFPWRLRFRMWWGRRQRSRKVNELLDTIAVEMDRRLLFGTKDNDHEDTFDSHDEWLDPEEWSY